MSDTEVTEVSVKNIDDFIQAVFPTSPCTTLNVPNSIYLLRTVKVVTKPCMAISSKRVVAQ